MESYSSTIHMVKYLAKFAPVYVIFGNVENSNSDTREISKEIGMKLPFLSDSFKKISRVRIINNIVANFRGLRIGGLEYFTDASWVREFKPSNYQENLRAVLKQNKKTKIILRNFGTVDILLCHQPPYGILDKVSSKIAPKSWQGKHAGSKIIRDYILKNHSSYVFCGHIHEAKGMNVLGKTEVYNLGVCGYKIIEFSDN